MPSAGEPLLSARGVSKHFGGVTALADYQVEIPAGILMGLIGPNGAGKTTVFNILSGVLPPSQGRVLLRGRDITELKPHQKARLGIARTFQNIRLFPSLSVLDNVKIALHMRRGKGLWPTLLHTPGFRRSEREMHARAGEYLELLGLDQVAREEAGNLPYGLQRRVEIARALATDPALLLLDEPAAGMNPNETAELVEVIRRIHAEYGLTIFLVEHDMKLVMALCQRIQVLEQGRVLALGTPQEIRADRRVVEAYLGKKKEAAHAQGQ